MLAGTVGAAAEVYQLLWLVVAKIGVQVHLLCPGHHICRDIWHKKPPFHSHGLALMEGRLCKGGYEKGAVSPLPSCIIKWNFACGRLSLLKARQFLLFLRLKSTQSGSSYALIYLDALAEPMRLIMPFFTIEPSTASTVVGLTSGRI